MKYFWISLILLGNVWAQSSKSPLFLPLSKDEKTYIKAGFRSQFWMRYTQANPQTTVNGKHYDSYFDISARRVRMSIQAKLSPKFFIFTQFGVSSYNMKTEKNRNLKLFDLYAEYEFDPKFTLGIGKIFLNGPSRWNFHSTGKMLNIDAMAFSDFTSDKQDDSGRSLGLFVKGSIDRFSYHLTVKNPTFTGVYQAKEYTDYVTTGISNQRWSGYLKYNFLDFESSDSSAGTYIGKKNIFNIGAGFAYQPNMTGQKQGENITLYDYKSWAIELFLDRPISSKNDAITAYIGFFRSDFGKDYLRYMSSNNIADNSAIQGNAYPAVGTGNTLFFQFGYLLAKSEKSSIRWQPSLSVQYSKFEKLINPVVFFDAGLNIYLKGHDSKLTFGIQNRPIFTENNTYSSRKSTFIIQYQVQI